MPYRHSHSGGLRWMDYDADAESNAIRFPSDGVGGTTATYAGCDIDGYISSIVFIQVLTAASGATQTLTIEQPDETVLQTTDVTTGLAAGQNWRPIMQVSSTVLGNDFGLNSRKHLGGMEIPGGWGIQVAAGGSNTSKVRVYYSVV